MVKRLACSVYQVSPYHILYGFQIEECGYRDATGKTIPKKEIVKSKRYSGKHWQYDEIIKYTVQNNDALEEYHYKLPDFYMEYGNPMEDEELDSIFYGNVADKSA